MAKKGMFGWLGFGRKKESKEIESQQPAEVVVESDNQEDVDLAPEVETESVTEAVTVNDDEQDVAASEVVEPQVSDTKPTVEASADVVEPEAVEQVTLAQEPIVPEPEIVLETPVVDVVPEVTQPVEPESEIVAAPIVEEIAEVIAPVVDAEIIEQPVAEPEPVKKSGFFTRLKEGLKRTKQSFGSGFFSIFKGKQIDDELFEDLEERLLIADVGVDTTLKVIKSLTEGASRKQLKDGEALYQLLQDELATIIEPVSQPLVIEKSITPYVILMVGVNGVGKTTTIGKMAKKFQQEGKTVALAAGDTFRAAAVEQLQVWGERNDITVIAQHTGADSASVIFDAVQAAKARNIDVLIADTAGRLQNKAHLMNELEKIVRVMKKLDGDAPHEVMLTLDAGTGQNAISQVELFNQAVGVTGLTLTKLDGTAKGGVIFALADKFGIPIRYIGVGEGIDDLREFDSKEFIEALFVKDE